MSWKCCMFVILKNLKYIIKYRGGYDSECAIGYEGILCHECVGIVGDYYFARSGANKCTKCNSIIHESMVIVAILVALSFYIIFMMV